MQPVEIGATKQEFRVEQALPVGQRALGHAWQSESFAHGGHVEDVFDVSQTFHGRVEEGDQVRDDDVIVEKFAVGMMVMLAQTAQLILDQADNVQA